VLVLAYHGGVPGLEQAGFYGVDVFFVLSGFLITTLLLGEHAGTGRIAPTPFWACRARRLLPGLLAMIGVVSAYVIWVAPAGRYPGFRSDALSVLAYASNWHFVQQSSNYFSATGIPSLLTHTWSLAIEEQFYVVWPLVLWGASKLARRASRDPAFIVLLLSAGGALASAGWMAYLYRSGVSVSRLYYGTDTHAQSVLVGGALAALTGLVTPKLSKAAAGGGAAMAAAGLGWAACSLGSSDPLTYEGGFLAVSLLTAVLVTVVVSAPWSATSRLLSFPPLAYVGRISYGMYLWYFPLFEVIDRAGTGLDGPALFLVRCTADVLAAALSYHFIEVPARQWTPVLIHRAVTGPRVLAVGAAAAVVAGGVVLVDGPTGYPSPSLAPVAASAVGDGTTAAGPGLRVLVFGDSTSATLADDLAFSAAARRHQLVMGDVSMFGCGLVINTAVSLHGQTTIPPAACRVSSPPEAQWPALLRAAVAGSHPTEVLIAAGRWELESRQATPGGPWLNITEPADATYVRSQLELAASIVEAGGARAALATAPCFASGEQPNGDPWPEDSPPRLDAYNALVRQVAARAPDRSLVDLDSMVCPGGRFHSRIDGVTVRAPDGIHYPYFDWRRGNDPDPDTVRQAQAFGTWIGPRVLGPLTGAADRAST
jgi:peptidoglycan/LPS O-acetylase OafA/YrhL